MSGTRRDLAEAVEGETGRAATRTRRDGSYPITVAILLGFVAAPIAWLVIRPGPGWEDWVVLGGIVAVVVGGIVAVNPRRSSPAGGTQRR